MLGEIKDKIIKILEKILGEHMFNCEESVLTRQKDQKLKVFG